MPNINMVGNVFFILKFKMEEVVTYGEKFRNDFSGTIQKPVFVSKIPGKSGRGEPLLMKIEDKIYQVNRHQKRKKWNDYRCKSGENRSKGSNLGDAGLTISFKL